jgi:hypothetical protein
MSDVISPADVQSPVRTSLTQQQKEALLGEVLGDVQLLHRSMQDLVAVTTDTDERISARIVELRSLTGELLHARETVLAEVALRSSAQARGVFEGGIGERFRELTALVSSLHPESAKSQTRRFVDLTAVAFITASLTSLATLTGVWMVLHSHFLLTT